MSLRSSLPRVQSNLPLRAGRILVRTSPLQVHSVNHFPVQYLHHDASVVSEQPRRHPCTASEEQTESPALSHEEGRSVTRVGAYTRFSRTPLPVSQLHLGPGDFEIRNMLANNSSQKPTIDMNEGYSTFPCILRHSPLAELNLLRDASKLFFDWQWWGKQIYFRWYKPMKAAWLNYGTDVAKARKAYENICRVEIMNPNPTLKVVLNKPTPDGNPPNWAVYIQNLDLGTNEDDIEKLVPRNHRPVDIIIRDPLHTRTDEDVLNYLYRNLDTWAASTPHAKFKIQLTKNDKLPLSEAVATVGFDGANHYESSSAKYARFAMQYLLETTNSKEPNGGLEDKHSQDAVMPVIQLYRRQGVHYTIPIRFAQLIAKELAEFQALCTGCNIRWNLNKLLESNETGAPYDERKFPIHINSDNVMNVARAKFALSTLLEGSLIHVEKFNRNDGKPIYHDWFSTPEGETWTQEIGDKCDVYMHVDPRYKRITVHGPKRNERKAHILIYDKLLGLFTNTSDRLVPKIVDRVAELTYGGQIMGEGEPEREIPYWNLGKVRVPYSVNVAG